MSTISYELRDPVAVLTMDDGKVNAMAMPFFDDLNAALDRAEREKPKAVVVTGRAGAFSAGLNLKVLPTLPPDELSRTLTTFGRTLVRWFTFPVPTVAAVTGHAIAGGAFLMMACDLRYVAEGPWKIHANEVAIGLVLPTWAMTIAESAIPPRFHTEALLHARPYLPDEAFERHIIHGVVRPAERVLDVALEAAAPLAALDQASYAASKRRQRAMRVEWASRLIDEEMVALPKR
jgi:enoyl-CoA hydratase